MTDRLRTALLEAANDARDYADAERAAVSARRARTRRRLLAVPAAAAAAAIAAFAVPALTPDDRGRTPVASEYPAVVARPERAPALPARPVGEAALIYAPCLRQCDPFLVLPTGAQYALPRPERGGPTAGYSLSPDGRWLGQPSRSGFRLRDLQGNGGHELHDDGPGASEAWGWSPESRWLLLVRHTDGVVDHFEAVEVRSGARHPVAAGGRTPLAIRDDGTVLYWQPKGARLAVADISTGSLAVRAEVTPDLRSLLRSGETVRPESLRPGPGGRVAALTVTRPDLADDLGQPTALLLVDLADGHAVRRVDLPASGWSAEAGVWEPRAVLADGALLLRSTPARTEVVRLDTVTGDRMVLSTLPRESQVVLRGSSR